MAKILITGGAGFIGSNFVHKLLKNTEMDIFILDSLTYAANLRNLPDNILLNTEKDRCHFFHGDIIDEGIVDDLVSKSDYIIHFAAETHVTRSIHDNKKFFETEVIGTQRLANATAKYKNKIKKFIHISTSEVYGTALTKEMNETHPLNPCSPYAAAKCGADRLIYSYWRTYDLPMIIVRPFNNYGPRQHLEKVIPRFITSAILKEEIVIHGDGSAQRDYIYVDDLCNALMKLLELNKKNIFGEVINIGSGKDISVIEIAQTIIDHLGSSVKIAHVGNRPGQVARHTCDYQKAKNLLNWEPLISWEEGIKRTIQWYVDNPKNWQDQLWMRKVPIINLSGEKEFH